MPETIQVIRVAQVRHDAHLGTTVTFFDDNNQRWAITGDVIELTEERMVGPDEATPLLSGEFSGPFYGAPRRRWMSEWEPVDA